MAHRGVEGGTSHSGRHMQTSAAQVDPRRLAREGGARRELEHAASHCRRASQLQRMAACLLPEAHLAQTHARPTPYWPHRRQTQRGGGKAEPAYGALRRAAVRGRHLEKARQRTVHCTVYCIIQCTMYCTTHCTTHCTMQSTIGCTW